MIGLIQRVTHAQVDIDKQCVGKIDNGMLVLLGIEKGDDQAIARKLADKLLKLRIFNDDNGKMNLNLAQSNGQMLVVSQFTLAADTRKGNRPGFSQAAAPDLSESLYHYFIEYCQAQQMTVQTGQFGADMQVSLCNDGPVTFNVRMQ